MSTKLPSENTSTGRNQSSAPWLPKGSLLFAGFCALVLFVAIAFDQFQIPFRDQLLAWSFAAVVISVIVLNRDYLNPLLAFLVPWAVIGLFGTVELSQYARPVSNRTYVVMMVFEVTAVLAYWLADLRKPRKRITAHSDRVNDSFFHVLVAAFVAFSIFNIALAGYVPLFRGIQTGDTGYGDFGIHGIYGFYNAFGNALGVLSFYLFLTKGRRKYLLICLAILFVFALFVTRQNMISLGLECFVVYCLARKRVSLVKLAATVAIALVGLSYFGTFRSGDIKQIAAIKQEYRALPDSVIWVYAYSYFNLLNLDNVVAGAHAPSFDGSSLDALIPSFMRPKTNHTDEAIEISEFNAYSFAAPLYADVGLLGLSVFTFLVMWISARLYQSTQHSPGFFTLATYAVLFYCALFSFFVNCWFYLPIIFQIPLLKVMERYVLSPRAEPSYAASRCVDVPST